jgi:hypothetical protein
MWLSCELTSFGLLLNFNALQRKEGISRINGPSAAVPRINR